MSASALLQGQRFRLVAWRPSSHHFGGIEFQALIPPTKSSGNTMANNKAIEGPNSQATAPRVKRARKVFSPSAPSIHSDYHGGYQLQITCLVQYIVNTKQLYTIYRYGTSAPISASVSVTVARPNSILGCEPFGSCRYFRTMFNPAPGDQIATCNCEQH